MATVLISGGTGLVGKALTRALIGKGYQVIILTRNLTLKNLPTLPGLSYAKWSITDQYIDNAAIGKADYIIHLAGAGIADRRWTKKRKSEIVNSRVEGGKLIAQKIEEIPNQVKAVICASAIGWYGPDPVVPNPHSFVESNPPAKDFLGETCLKWQMSLEPVANSNKRVVFIRTGIVVSKAGGAIPEFVKFLRFGIAPILGTGKQIMSWIHLEDLVNIYIAAIENPEMKGAYNAVSPESVTNKKFIIQLAKSRKRFFIPFKVPAFLLKLIKGEMSIEVLKSTTVSSEKIKKTGFNFRYPDIDSAFQEISSS